MRVRAIALLVCLTFGCVCGAIAQDQIVITNGIIQITEQLCKDDSGLFYFPDGLGWQVYGIGYWQPMWIDFSEFPSLGKLKLVAASSSNQCVLGASLYGVRPLHATVMLDLLSGDLVLNPGCSSEELASVAAPKDYQAGQWPADCRVVERLWEQWQTAQKDPDWKEWYGSDAKPFLRFHFQLADLNEKQTYEDNLIAEELAWEEAQAKAQTGMFTAVSESEGGGMMLMLTGDPCDTNEFQILDIQSDEPGWVTVGWCAASNVVYQIQAAPEMLTNTAWEAQALYVGEGYASWTDTNAPAFNHRFYRCRALPGDEDADSDGLSNMAEFNLGTGIDNPDTDGDGIVDGDEATYGTNPLNPDSDNDFWLDGVEVLQGYSPTNSANFPDFGFTVNGGADVVTNAQLHIDLAAGLIADYTIVSEDITFTSGVTNAFASSFDYTLGKTNDGMHTLFLILLKAGGTTSPQFGRTFELDTHPPTLTINSPTNGFITSRRRINIEGFAADAATNAPSLDASRPMLVAINGIQANDRDTNGLWWAGLQDLVPGTNEIVAVATDRAGFVVSNSVWFIYDAALATNVPVFTVDVTNTVVVGSNATTVAVSGAIDDDNATVQINLLDASDSTITNATVSAAVQGTNWWAELPVLPGSNIVVVTAQNGSSPPATNGFCMIQNANVFLEITSPAANSAINTSAVTVAGIAGTNFDGAITINGSPASTSLTSSGIVFSGTVPINNVDANVIEVAATGTDGSSAVVRQLVYGYEVVAFKYRYWYYYKHLTDDCWYSHHYPTEHYDHGDYYMEESWAAPAAEGTGWDDSHEYGIWGALISSFSDSWTWSWNPKYLPTPDTGRIEYYSYTDGKRLHPTYQINYGFRDGSGFPEECSCQNAYCEGEPTENCWIDSKEERLDVEIGEHETTFMKHWPKDEEQTVILHFKNFYYYDRDTDVTKIKLWGQPGFAYDFVQHTGWVFTNVGFLVKIKTNTRYTLRERDFEWPHTPENSTWYSPNAQSINREYEDWHAFYYNSFANALPRLDIISSSGAVVPQDKKATEGEVIAVNYDDDDNDGIARGQDGKIESATSDKDDTDGVQGENDLIQLKFYKLKDMDPASYKFHLEYVDTGANQHVVLWKSKSKNGQNDEKIVSETTEFPVDQDNTVWVEGIKAHDTDEGEFVTLKLVKADGSPVEGATDKVKIVVAKPIIVVFGDGGSSSSKLAVLDYLNPLYKDRRPQPRIVREQGQDRWYSIEVFGTSGSAGEKLLEMALATEGSIVVYEGHSNFGLGPALSSGLTSLSAFVNTAPALDAINWDYLRTIQGHPNLEIADSEIPADPVSYQGNTYTLQGSGYGRYHFMEGSEKFLIVKAGSADVPPLRYETFFYRGCESLDYLSDVFAHGTLFGTIPCVPPGTDRIRVFVQSVLLGQTRSEIRDSLNSGQSGTPYQYIYH